MDEQPKSDNNPDDNGEPNWQFNSDEASAAPASADRAQPDDKELLVSDRAGAQPVMAREAGDQDSGIEWTASEFIARAKPAWWYLSLAGVTAAICAAVYFSGHDVVAVAAVIIIGIIFGIIAARKPRTLTYRLDNRGLQIMQKLYPYNHFKAFSLAREGAFTSLNLLPLRRFMPVLTVYYDPADETAITGVIGDYLPLETHQLDPIDKLLHKIRF